MGPTTTKIVPTSVVRDVLQQLHDDCFGGHLGIDKTADRVREGFIGTLTRNAWLNI